MVKFSQEGLKKKDDSCFAGKGRGRGRLLLLLLALGEFFAMLKGGKLEKRLMDLCLHKRKKPCHSVLIRTIWVSLLEVLALGLVSDPPSLGSLSSSKPFKSAYRNS